MSSVAATDLRSNACCRKLPDLVDMYTTPGQNILVLQTAKFRPITGLPLIKSHGRRSGFVDDLG